MAGTAKTAKEDIDKVCENECSVTWHNTSTKKKGRCSKPNYKKCYKSDSKELYIYRVINWKKFKNGFNKFLEDWLKQPETITLLNELFVLLVNKDPTITPITPSYITQNLVKEKDDKCNDFNHTIKASIKYGGDRTITLRLFHIAFHPKEPKVTTNKDKPHIFSCGHYPNPTSKPSQSNFHYKIDSGKQDLVAVTKQSQNKFHDLEFNSDEQPYTEFKFNYKKKEEALLYNKPTVLFVNNDALKSEKRDAILAKHGEIYSHFINHWNSSNEFRDSIKCQKPKKGGKQSIQRKRRRRRQKYITRKINKKTTKKNK